MSSRPTPCKCEAVDRSFDDLRGLVEVEKADKTIGSIGRKRPSAMQGNLYSLEVSRDLGRLEEM